MKTIFYSLSVLTCIACSSSPSVSPGKDGWQGQVDKHIRNQSAQFEACFKKDASAQAAYRFHLVFIIGTDGSVSHGMIDKSSNPRNQNIEECVLNVLNAIVFDPPKDNVPAVINYPLNYSGIRYDPPVIGD